MATWRDGFSWEKAFFYFSRCFLQSPCCQSHRLSEGEDALEVTHPWLYKLISANPQALIRSGDNQPHWHPPWLRPPVSAQGVLISPISHTMQGFQIFLKWRVLVLKTDCNPNLRVSPRNFKEHEKVTRALRGTTELINPKPELFLFYYSYVLNFVSNKF